MSEAIAAGCVLALGKFDALHRGHRRLLMAAAEHGHPVLTRFTGMAAVLGWAPRLPLCAERDVDRVLRLWQPAVGRSIERLDIEFAEVRQLNPAEFVSFLQQAYAPSAVVTGRDFRFGKNRIGDCTTLASLCAKHGIQAHAVDLVCDAAEQVSSSWVRALLAAGDVQAVATLLDRPYRLLGVVQRGDARGRTIGFPTANVACETALPALGVYAALAVLADGRSVPCAVNIGRQPTVGEDRPVIVEAHLIDWSGDCYDQELAVDLLDFVRPEQRFADLTALQEQLQADVQVVKERVLAG